MEQRESWQDTVTKQLRDFIAERDSFYMATVNGDVSVLFDIVIGL